MIDWNLYTGVYDDVTVLDTDCGIAYTDENFTDSVGGTYTESNCSLGIGQNNSGTFCSIRMGLVPLEDKVLVLHLLVI